MLEEEIFFQATDNLTQSDYNERCIKQMQRSASDVVGAVYCEVLCTCSANNLQIILNRSPASDLH